MFVGERWVILSDGIYGRLRMIFLFYWLFLARAVYMMKKATVIANYCKIERGYITARNSFSFIKQAAIVYPEYSYWKRNGQEMDYLPKDWF